MAVVAGGQALEEALETQTRTRVIKVDLHCSPRYSPMALGSKSSSHHTCGLVVTCSMTSCLNGSVLNHLVYLSGHH